MSEKMNIDEICNYTERHGGNMPQGYIWWSDATEPVVFSGNEPLKIDAGELDRHFIVEGCFYDAREARSYSLKFIDGRYHIHPFGHISENDMKDAELYVPERMGKAKVSALRLVRRWAKVEDPNCDGMEVFQPSEFIFVGFEK